jgi:signal transduction histidine kinase
MRLTWTALFFLIGSSIIPSICSAASSVPRSVLILEQSPGPFYVALSSAVKSRLMSGSPAPTATYTENLDMGRFNGPQVEAYTTAYFKEKYRDKPIGIVFVSGSLALDFALRARAELWPGTPIVFAGVDETSVNRLNLPCCVTGITMQLSLRDMVKAARAVVPDLKRIALVGNSLRNSTLFRHFEEELPAIVADLELIDLTGLPMGDLRRRVAALPDDAAILYTGIFSDGAGFSYVPVDALGLVAEVANRPIVIDEEWYLGHGAVGGFIIDVEQLGKEAADVLSRILDGESAANIPFVFGQSLKPVFDWRQLQRWGIDESRLPLGSEVRFREPSMWNRYRWQIALVFAALLFQGFLIIDLFAERWRRRRAEALARQRMGELAHMDRVATAGELSASIVHEVSQPLSAMVVNANAGLRWLSRATPDLERVGKALAAIVSDGHRASDVLGSIRAMFKKDLQEPTSVDVNELVREVLALTASELQTQSVITETKLSSGTLKARGSHVQLQQVLLNIVMNAIDAMKSVSGRQKRLRVTTRMEHGREALITVEDSGPGIAAEDIERIFDHFFTTKAKGIGMGLAICKSIVDAHDGRLWASAGSNGGAVFHILLPLAGDGIR